MWFVWVMLGIAVVGLISVVMWAVWLFHKAADLFSELAHLGGLAEEALQLAESIQTPTRD